MEILQVEGLSIGFDGASILKNTSFNVHEKNKLAIIGASGSGKTTLLKAIAGFIQPTSGKIFFKQNKVLGPNEKLLHGHSEIAYLSQFFELRNNYSVEEIFDIENKLADDEAENIYKLCDVSHLLKRKTNQLSGGEKQRISLAIALIKKPKLILLDEPFSNADFEHKHSLKKIINNVIAQLNVTCVLVSHEPTDVLSWANEILVLQNGNIIQQANLYNVYYKPVNRYVAGLLGEFNLIENSFLNHFTNYPQAVGKKLFLRPEQIDITEAKNIFQKDIIQQIFFNGSYYLVEVLVNNEIIKVKTQKNTFKVGERVTLSVKEQSFWFM